MVGMEPHYRLRERLDSAIAHEARRPQGLIVVNGYRDQSPSQRSQQYEESLRVAAESMRYCVVDSTQIFEAVRDQMDGKDVSAFCRRLIETEGVLASQSAAALNSPSAD
jgi:hypothetical protein